MADRIHRVWFILPEPFFLKGTRMGGRSKGGSAERRRFPRKPTQVKVRLRALRNREITFEAHLPSRDISIGGIFLESEFFIRTGTRLRAEFQLEPGGPPVLVEGIVVRQERVEERGGVRSGFALDFTDYLGDAKLLLARHFLIPQVSAFLETYLASGRASRLRLEKDRLLDVLVAWELERVEKGESHLKP